MISLSKITLKNFKIFGEEPYSINFEDQRLVLLDGPNGYGKTSVFDGIELGLTGNLTRLISLDARQNPTDVVVAHQGKGMVEIHLEFKDSGGQIRKFRRRLKNAIPNSSKKISKFPELWEIHEIVDDNIIPSSQLVLDEYFESKNFKRDFLLFHYVQQEETSRFLKSNNEVQRAEELAQLFGNTLDADEKLHRLADIHGKIAAQRRKNERHINEIKQHYKLDENTSMKMGGTESHFYLLPWLSESSSSPLWDGVDILELNEDMLNKSLKEINYIKDFLEYNAFFFRNHRFESAIAQKEVIQLFVGYFNNISQYDLHIEKSNIYRLINDFLLILKKNELTKLITNDNLDYIFKVLGYQSCEEFKTAINSLLELEKRYSGLNSIFSELIRYHTAMHDGLKKIPNESVCLLCGHDYKNHDTLNDAIFHHGDLLRRELSEQDKFLVEARDSFNIKFTIPLISICSIFIEKNTLPSQEELLSLSKALAMKDRFSRFKVWLQSEEIEYVDLLASSFPIEGGSQFIADATMHLCNRIRSAIGSGPDSYYEANIDNVFDRIYSDYFKNQQTRLSEITSQKLESKENYIKNVYFNSLKEVSEKLSNILKTNAMLEKAEDEVNDLVTIIKKRVKQYRKKLITDIEIPFYIYSGKILQSHQAGLGHGIFIKDPTGNDELKNVRLVSNWESDHDILNTMSSGQISAIVIALTLALHKVYSSRFSSILIDDPVQTMDDINMSSLVEVLRNDFKDKQVILSTHEDKVARYFTYKYLKHSEGVKIINLMQREEYIPSNRFNYKKLSQPLV